MKKLFLALFLLVTIAAVVLGGYAYTVLCPKADPLQHPDAECVLSVTVSDGGDASGAPLSEQDIVVLFAYIRAAEPTRRQSLNDAPYATPYYRISLITAERAYVYYLYREDGVAYLESPYEGIYRIDEDAIDLLSKYV